MRKSIVGLATLVVALPTVASAQVMVVDKLALGPEGPVHENSNLN